VSIFVHSSMFLPAFPLGRVAGQQLYVDPKYFTVNSSFRKFPSVHTKTGPSKVGDVVTRHLVLEPLDCFPADVASRTCLVNLSWASLETWSNHPAWIFRIRKVAWHSGLYGFQTCAFCHEVSHPELFAKIPSLPLVLGKVFFWSLLEVHVHRRGSKQRPL